MERLLKSCVVILVLAFLSITAAYSQEDDTLSGKPEEKISHRWHRYASFHGHPTIVLKYGLSALKLSNVSVPFAGPGLAEIRIGQSNTRPVKRDSSVLKSEFTFLLVGALSTELQGKSTGNEINSELWKFGPGWIDGYGYRLGTTGEFILWHESGFEWSRLNIRDHMTGGGPPDLARRNIITPADSVLLAPFDGTFRFGTMTGGGITIQPVSMIAITAGYERQIIFPAHLFWKWLGSEIIEVAGQGAIDHFVSRVLRSTPAAAPIVSFVLKNGFSYAFYELRRDKMNYPFDTDPPLRNDAVTFGLTFSF